MNNTTTAPLVSVKVEPAAVANCSICMVADALKSCQTCQFKAARLLAEIAKQGANDTAPLNWHNRIEFDTQAIGENIRARSAELKARIDARMAETRRRDAQARSTRL